MNLLRALSQSSFALSALTITWSFGILLVVARPEPAALVLSWALSIFTWTILSETRLFTKSLKEPTVALSEAQGDWIHTLSQPIHSALFAASALQRPDFAPEKRDRYVQQIQASLQEAADLIKKPGGTPP